jgi:CheY-like chemotaxis protein
MAMLPFIGYHAGDYMNHWLKIGKQADESKLPKIYQVNWFRKDADGHWLWPGFGDNSRVLKWVVERLEGEAEAIETPVGLVPAPGAIDTTGLDMADDDVTKALAVDLEDWRKELPLIEEWFAKIRRHPTAPRRGSSSSTTSTTSPSCSRWPCATRAGRSHGRHRHGGGASGPEFEPDAVVLDMMLPDMDGLEVLRRMREHNDRLPVLFLTARDAVEDRIAGLTAGGDDYVTKPFSLEEVVAGCARSCAAPCSSRRRGRLPPRRRRPHPRRGQPRGDPRRRPDPAHRNRVRAAALPHAQPQAGAVQGPDPRPGLELRLRRPGQRRRALHLLPAQEDRRRPRADDPHDARRRLRPQAPRGRTSARSRAGSRSVGTSERTCSRPTPCPAGAA